MSIYMNVVYAKENGSNVAAIPEDGSVVDGVTYYSSSGFKSIESSGCNFWYHDSFGNQDASCFFDGYNSGDWKMGSDFSGTLSIVFEYKEAITPDKYYIVSGRDGLPDRNPESWTLYGSNDKDNWTKLDEQNCDFGENMLTPFSYSINPDSAYKYFKLEIKNTGGMELSEFYMSKGSSANTVEEVVSETLSIASPDGEDKRDYTFEGTNFDVLAYALYPTFDPNNYKTATSEQLKNWTLRKQFKRYTIRERGINQ